MISHQSHMPMQKMLDIDWMHGLEIFIQREMKENKP